MEQQRVAEGRHLLATTRYKELTADGEVKVATVQSPFYTITPRNLHSQWRPMTNEDFNAIYHPGHGMTGTRE